MNDNKFIYKWCFLVISVISLVLFSSLSFGATINVPTDYSTIHAAIDAASDGDTVMVADGTYTGEGNKDLDFKGKAITVQSENGAENCIIDCENDGRGFYFHTGEGADSVVSGFTVTNGRVADNGAGIYCSSSSPTIRNCIISNNTAYGGETFNSYGGGISCNLASPSITNCTISNNRCSGVGGFSETYGYGGGISCTGSSPTITNCTISNNTVSGRWSSGGGIYCASSSSPTINKCTISGNTVVTSVSRAAPSGGGIYCSSSSPTITNCLISGNTASGGGSGYGGGISCSSASSPTIMNCTLSNNTAFGYDLSYGGGIYSRSSSPAITNCILWDNTPDEIYGPTDATYSDIKGGYSGLGNINSDPLFVSSGAYELQANSPCINSGTSTGAPSTDIDGTPRPQGAGYDMGAYEFFLASSAPTSITGSATKMTSSSATLNGTLNPNGGSSWYYFEYGTTTSYGSITESATAGAGTTSVLVSADIAELELGTTYHFRLVGANNAGTNYGSDQTFVTSPTEPSVTTDTATSVTIDGATLNGIVNPNGASTTYYFEYGITTSYGSTTTVTEAGSGTSAVSVNAGISGLELNTTYHFRLVATNSVGTTNGSDQTFTTNALTPSVSTGLATSVTSNTATLNGTINPNGASTTYYFEYGITTAYGSTTITTSAGSGTSAVSVNANITGLSESTTYHFRLVATNSIGTTSGSDQTFTTSPPVGPTVTTGLATLITSDTVTLKGKVNPNGSSTEAYFEYGTTTSYESFTSFEDIGAGTSSLTVSATISDLIPDTTYHYRLTATNIDGTSSGADMTFYTAIIYVSSSDGTCGGNTPCYTTIQGAADAADSGSIIKIAEGTYDEDLILDSFNNLTLRGGWDSSFTTQLSTTNINSLTIADNSGTIEIENIVLQ